MLVCYESDGEGRKKDWNEEFLHASEGKESLLALSRIKTRRMGSLCDCCSASREPPNFTPG